MLTREQLKVIADFLLDGAKIIFGSLVVGVFVPAATGKIPWLTVLLGLALTAAFLIGAMGLVKILKEKI